MSRRSRRIPLSSWTDRGLHATAGRFQRLMAGEGLTRQQDWLFTAIVNEMEWRYSQKARLRLVPEDGTWYCHGCDLCRPAEGQVPGQQRIVVVGPKTSR